MTEPHPAPFFDTGPHPEPLLSRDDDFLSAVEHGMDVDLRSAVSSVSAPAVPVAVPGHFHFVKRWKLAVQLVGVWIVAAAIGVGLYYWWFQAIDKTWPDAGVLLYVIVCVVSALLVSMTDDKPMLSGLALGIMSAPFAAGCAAGALYGAVAFGWVTP